MSCDMVAKSRDVVALFSDAVTMLSGTMSRDGLVSVVMSCDVAVISCDGLVSVVISCDVVVISCDVLLMSYDVTEMPCDTVVKSCDVVLMSCDIEAALDTMDV